MLQRVGCWCCCQLNQLKDYFWMRGYLSCIYGGDAESSFRHSNGWTYESDVELRVKATWVDGVSSRTVQANTQSRVGKL